MNYNFELSANALTDISADLLFLWGLVGRELGGEILDFVLHDFEGTLRRGSSFYDILSRELERQPVIFSEHQFVRFALDIDQTINARIEVRSKSRNTIVMIIDAEDSTFWNFSTNDESLYIRLVRALGPLERNELASVHWLGYI